MAAVGEEVHLDRDAPRARSAACSMSVFATGTEASSSAWSRKQGGAFAGTCKCGEWARSSAGEGLAPSRLRREPAWASGALIEITG